MGGGGGYAGGGVEVTDGRKARAKALEDMKRMARRAGFKDARIVIQENGWPRREEEGAGDK